MLSDNNWVEMNWEGRIPRNMKENFTVSIKRKAAKIESFDAICDKTAKDIASKHNDLYLALSGGADSEHVANVLHRNNIPFTPIVMTLLETETPETNFAIKWCKHRNIEPLRIHFDHEILLNGVYRKKIIEARSRLLIGVTPLLVLDEIEKRGGKMISGMQVEYHPDEQFNGTEGIPTEYKGFVINESDAYQETISPNKHPWAFFYWSPEILASTIYNWDTTLSMARAKEKLYGTEYRPKMINTDFLVKAAFSMNKKIPRDAFGTIDCALMGDTDEFLSKLVG
jgi:asparagine synthetase B (glutamine-hydrolysing)